MKLSANISTLGKEVNVKLGFFLRVAMMVSRYSLSMTKALMNMWLCVAHLGRFSVAEGEGEC